MRFVQVTNIYWTEEGASPLYNDNLQSKFKVCTAEYVSERNSPSSDDNQQLFLHQTKITNQST